MKIEFTKEEFASLIRLTFIGEWISHMQDSDDCEEHEKLIQKLYQHAKDADLADWVEYDKDMKEYFLAEAPEEELLGKLEEYEDFLFWDELVSRMAQRDIYKEMGEAKVDALQPEEEIEVIKKYERKYINEIEKNGLENFFIKE